MSQSERHELMLEQYRSAAANGRKPWVVHIPVLLMMTPEEQAEQVKQRGCEFIRSGIWHRLPPQVRAEFADERERKRAKFAVQRRAQRDARREERKASRAREIERLNRAVRIHRLIAQHGGPPGTETVLGDVSREDIRSYIEAGFHVYVNGKRVG